jgi:hypothetical protein
MCIHARRCNVRDGDVHNFCAQISGGTLGAPSLSYDVLGGIRAARHASMGNYKFLRGAHNMCIHARRCEMRDGDVHNFCAQISGGTLGALTLTPDVLEGIRPARHASMGNYKFLRGAQNMCIHARRSQMRDGDVHNFCAQISGGTVGAPSMTPDVLGGIRAARHAWMGNDKFLRGAQNMCIHASRCQVHVWGVHNFCAQISGGTVGAPSLTPDVLGGIRAARHAWIGNFAFLRGAHNMCMGARRCQMRDGDVHNFCAQISGGTLGAPSISPDAFGGIRAARHAWMGNVAFFRGAHNM